ncbi:Pyridoxal phosphate (PLP)-dependent transferases superfamily protein isoform 1 [Tripterygium wilfordii]|uniref:Pyridoxal phosphate (PLP)-dependent transferases superfamily protein isoform 1 n=1 Tax=Tripterygium wilfordii TaxID=458696 RepID=A0A7J7CH96_TRIWF|nr:L-cysteine desulfhydrase [Tripterygium wilfordii]KAF5733428.1 Pyridoxal phosphate (PLP)-dependent transferases superfamily protein isoform 1 [Tripterygium wilfordii]
MPNPNSVLSYSAMEHDDPRNGDSTHNLDHASKKLRMTRYISESDIREEFSHHQPGIARINNGSFGSCPGSVLSAQREWQLRFLQQPDDFYSNTLRDGILRSRTVIKDLINADHVDEVSLVDNATTAAAIVLQQIGRGFAEGRFAKNDTVVMLHCAFQAVKKSIQAYVSRAGGSVVEVQLPFPVDSDEEIIAEFRKGLQRGKADGRKIRLAIIDHITSMPCVVMPVRELVRICREEDVERVFVDAAHAIGSVKVDVKDIGADFYVSNFHKWCFCPPAVAFLYCRVSGPPNDVHHPVVSHEYGNGLPIESAWIGTRDYSSQLVVPSALEFVSRFEGGLEGIMKRNHEEVVKMGKMLAESWGTILGSPPEMCAAMIMVGLPSRLCIKSNEDASRLRSHLRASYGVEVPLHYQTPKDGENVARDKDGLITGYARISHQVYNSIEDYFKFRDAINQLIEDKRICKILSVE